MEWARWAVGRWSGFPVDQTPRPVVLVGSRVHVEAGFATGEAKMAFLEGRWDPAVEVPAPVLDELRRQGNGVRSGGGASLVVTSVELAESEFVTDRGRRRLPAWRLTVQDALGPIWVRDPEIVDWRPSEGAGELPQRCRHRGMIRGDGCGQAPTIARSWWTGWVRSRGSSAIQAQR